MKKRFFFVLLLPPFSLLAQSLVWQWPIKGKAQISSTFGESRIDHFHNGIDLAGENLAIYPVSEGELIFAYEVSYYPNELPFGGGKTIILRHGPYLSGYMHLNEFQKNNLVKRVLGKDDILALSGNTGHSASAHLHFFIMDSKDKKLINPLLLLPKNFYVDNLPPQRSKIGVVLPEKISFIDPKKEFRMTQNYPLAIELVDSGVRKERWGVYELRVFGPSGEVLHEVEFDFLFYKENRWQTKNGLSFFDVYYGPYYLLGKGIRQKRDIRIEARGFLGPSYLEDLSFKILLQ